MTLPASQTTSAPSRRVLIDRGLRTDGWVSYTGGSEAFCPGLVDRRIADMAPLRCEGYLFNVETLSQVYVFAAPRGTDILIPPDLLYLPRGDNMRCPNCANRLIVVFARVSGLDGPSLTLLLDRRHASH